MKFSSNISSFFIALLLIIIVASTSLNISSKQAQADINFTNLPMNIVSPPANASAADLTPMTFTALPTTTSGSSASSSTNSANSVSTTSTSVSNTYATSTLATSTAQTASTTPVANIFLDNDWQDASTTPSTNSGNTFHAQILSPNGTSTALIDLELDDQNGNKIIQQSWDNSVIPSTLYSTSTPVLSSSPTSSATSSSASFVATSPLTALENLFGFGFGSTTVATTTPVATSTPGIFTLQGPSNLLPGVYTWKVGIFNPGWNGTIHWYDKALTFLVTGTTTTPTNETIMLGGVWQNHDFISPNGTNYLSASFTNGDLPSSAELRIFLFDSNNHEVASRGWDYVYMSPRGTLTEGMTSPTLSPGSYHWSVGIFSTQGKKLYSWYDNIAHFTVGTADQNATSTQVSQ